MPATDPNPTRRRAALLGLAAALLLVWGGADYGSEPMTTPRSAPWWEVRLLAEPVRSAHRPTASVQTIPSAAPSITSVAVPRVVPTTWSDGVTRWPVAAGEVLLRVAVGTEEAVLDAVAQAGARAARVGGGSGLVRVAFGAEVAVEDALDRVLTVPGVLGAGPNAVAAGASCGPGDLVSLQWERRYATTPSRCADDARVAPVTIALLDTGVAYEDHDDGVEEYVAVPELVGVPFVHPWDFVNDDAHPNDDHQHGTHLAGLIASRDRLRGHAANPVLMPIKVLDDRMVGTEWTLVEGLYWAADHGAEVVNLSLTFGAGYLPSPALVDAIDAVHMAGGVVLAAAGNDGSGGVAYPAALSGVIAVGAYRIKSTSEVRHAAYASSGPPLDVLGPGGEIDQDRDGNRVADGLIAQTIDPADPTSVAYWAVAGTSQATAVVSAQVANLLGGGVDPRAARDAVAHLGRQVTGNGWRARDGGGWVDSRAGESITGHVGVQPVFVNGVQAIVAPDGGTRRLDVHLEAIDARGSALPGVRIVGRVAGAVTHDFDAWTDSTGRATFSSNTVAASASTPLLFAVFVDAVVRSRGAAFESGVSPWPYAAASAADFVHEPGGFYRLGEGNAAVMGEALSANPDGGLVFRVAPQDGTGGPTDVCALFDCSRMDASWMASSLGGGLSASTVNVSFNWPWMLATAGSGLSASTVNVSLSRPYALPWGASDSEPIEIWDLLGSGLSASTVNVLRWNPGMFGTGLSASTVNVLRYDPRAFGAGAGSGSLVFVDDASATSWGSGLSSSTVNALDFHGPSSASGLSAWGSILGSGLSSSTVNAFTWSRLTMGATTGSAGVRLVGPSTRGSGAGAVPVAL